MANTKQARKMVRKTAKKTEFNKWWKKQIRVALGNLRSALEANNADQVKINYGILQKKVDKAVKNKIIHKNKGARIKSQNSKKLVKKA